eukprot:m.307171 g.307171  ORF g.307171 m.307171 type:complete len:1239 (-) comp16457_c0_seq36:1097-4813(-)
MTETEDTVNILNALDPSHVLSSQYDNDGYSPLLHAAALQKWKFVEAFLQHSPNVNVFVQAAKETVAEEPDNREDEENPQSQPSAAPKINQHAGWSFAHLLLVKKQTELFTRFVELGGDVNTCLETPDATPLVVASVMCPDICRMLLQNTSCDINAANSNGDTLLHAIFKPIQLGGHSKENIEKFKAIQQALPGVNTETAQRPQGEVTILHLTNVSRWNSGLDASIRNRKGETVFHTACASETTTSCIRSFLLKDPDALHIPNECGNTPLAIALKNRKVHVALYLIDQGADINGHIYWYREKKNSQQPQQQQQQNFGFGGGYRYQQQQSKIDDKDGEVVDNNRLRMSIYKFVMKTDLSADVVYNILQAPTCDMSAALGASISTGNLNWTDHLIRSVELKTSTDAGRFIRLLFSSTSNPTKQRQLQMLELAQRLAVNGGGVQLDNDEQGNNLFHICIDEFRYQSLTFRGLLDICGPQQSVEGLLQQSPKDKRNVLHMAVQANRYNTTRLILSYVKEYGSSEKLQELLDMCDGNSKTALHYAVASNSEGTYLNGALVALLVRFGATITIADENGTTVAMVIGQMPENHLRRFKLALTGQNVDDDTVEAGQLPPEAEAQIIQAQVQRTQYVQESTAKRATARTKYAQQWKKLQKTWEEFRVKRLQAKRNVFQEERSKAKAGKLSIDVQQSCPNYHAYEVYVSPEGDIYDALLITSNLKYNVFGTNSFCALQMVQLKKDYQKERVKNATALATAQRNVESFAYRLGPAKYTVLERWGRVGDHNVKSRNRGFMQLEAAVQYYEKLFFDKTKNKFSEREEFDGARGAYNWVQKVYDEVADCDEKNTPVDSGLSQPVTTMLRVITSLTKVRQDLRSDGFGVEGMPLNSLSPNTISAAYKILRNIETLVTQTEELAKLRGRASRENRAERYKVENQLVELSNQFYMTIPHDFGNVDSGFTKPNVINSRDQLKKNLRMLAALEDVENSINLLLSVSANTGVHQRLHDIYNLIGCNVRPVAKDSDKFKLIQQYAIAGAQGNVPKIAHVLQVTRYEDAVRFTPHEATRGMNNNEGQPMNRLLWHGSKVSNILGILMKGLKVAPPDAPVTGYMFGKGIYFADVYAKSAGYSSSRTSYHYGYRYNYRQQKKSATADIDHYKVMLLCEVAVGESCKLRNANSDLKEPPEGFDSVKGEGMKAPSSEGMFITKKGVGIPLGELTEAKSGDYCLNYNEYIVYDESRVRIKYLLLVE